VVGVSRLRVRSRHACSRANVPCGLLEGGTLTSSFLDLLRLLVLQSSGWVERGFVCGDGGVGTLLGPEGTNHELVGLVCFFWWLNACPPRTAGLPHVVGLSGARGFRVGVARTLRTAQWTRASLWQINKGARWMPWH
jgi:hypothetical protein